MTDLRESKKELILLSYLQVEFYGLFVQTSVFTQSFGRVVPSRQDVGKGCYIILRSGGIEEKSIKGEEKSHNSLVFGFILAESFTKNSFISGNYHFFL